MKSVKTKEYLISVPEDRDKKYQLFRYPAGEAQVRLLNDEIPSVIQAECVKVTANIRDGEIMELALLTNALDGIQEQFTGKRTYRQLILPYLPYARADRVFVKGDCHGLGTFATMINALEYDHVVAWDVHSDAAERLIRRLVVISSGELIAKAVRKIGRKDLLVILPDKGATRYESIIQTMGLNYEYAEKIRDAATGKLSGFKIPPFVKPYKKILIVDDICDGGGTFTGLGSVILNTALHIKPSFVPDLYLFVTHGIFSKPLNELAFYFKKIYTSDSFTSSNTKVPGLQHLVEVIKYS